MSSLAEWQPWDRLPGESVLAYAAFLAYRDAPDKDRSLRKLAREKGANVGQYERWSSKFRWQDRVQAWQVEQRKVADEARLAAIRQMNERHARAAVMYQTKALERLQRIQSADLTPSEALRYFSEAVRIERMARGEPDSIEETRMKRVASVDDLTDEDLLSVIAGRGAVAVQPEAGTEEV